MKRSELNQIIEDGIEFLEACNFHLPPFAFWSPEKWAQKGPRCDQIRTRALGWDVTDFGKGQFEKLGLLLFTLRNGEPKDPYKTKPYCEKIMILREGQRCPTHFHWQKVEDIINRAGGKLVIRLLDSDQNEQPRMSEPVKVSVDAVITEVPAGGVVSLEPGQSICLSRGLYHEFWAEGGAVLAGEVSSVNDDSADNRFLEPMPRFPEIEEDEPARHYLCGEYPPAKEG
ncbi:MAG: D-lyxose/D-mannose family sugar isomerase [Planctomycetes bacterium]|nr:D-lyxose/D-mannose family sugar isomerase [Planctomycetota bacterium]